MKFCESPRVIEGRRDKGRLEQAEFSRLRGISKSSLAYRVRRSERDFSFIRIDPIGIDPIGIDPEKCLRA